MSLTSTRLALSYLAEAQAQKHVTINESLRRLDALVHLSVESRSVSAEPADPADGTGFILPPGATGPTWQEQAGGTLAVRQDGAWTMIAPVPGIVVYIEDETTLAVHDGQDWQALSNPPKLGINTEADAGNRLAVKADGALFSHDDVTPGTGDMRLTVNKKTGAGTASFVFQAGYEARAEFGLCGSDDFTVKVRGDDGVFRDAIVIDRQTGAVSFPNTP